MISFEQILENQNKVVHLNEQQKFKYSPLPIHRIIQDNSQDIRHYETPDGRRYPSVTSVLGETKSPEDKEKLVQWRLRVGEEEADRVLKDSIGIGNRLHIECENFMYGNEAKAFTMRERRMMKPMFHHLRNNIDVVLGVELPLYSHRYKLAGTCDLVAIVNKRLTVVDFKNSKRFKRKEWVNDYRLQCTMYSMMLEDMYDMRFTDYRILMSCQDGTFLKFYGKTCEHRKEVIERIVAFHSK